MAGRLSRIVRHPLKSVGAEDLPAVTLTAGQALPFDRVWAVAHEAADLTPGEWAAKRNFLRGVACPDLMAVTARLHEATAEVTLAHPRAGTLSVRPDTAEAGARLIQWLAPMWPANRPAPARVVRAGAQPLTDVPEPWVAVLNLASLRALGQRMAQDLSIHRFRGNLWVDGLAPWEEFDLVGRRLRIGVAELEVTEPITRCEATCADPETGRPGGDTLAALEAGWGHRDFGVYARVVAGARVALGDAVTA